MAKPIEETKLKNMLGELPGWTIENINGSRYLEKAWTFANFKEAWGFLDHVARMADELNHHPEVWNVYNKVRLRLTTHDVNNQITDLDLKLAARIETAAKINF